MSLATPSDGRRRSGSGETQARPGATVKMIDKHALVHYLNEKCSAAPASIASLPTLTLSSLS